MLAVRVDRMKRRGLHRIFRQDPLQTTGLDIIANIPYRFQCDPHTLQRPYVRHVTVIRNQRPNDAYGRVIGPLKSPFGMEGIP